MAARSKAWVCGRLPAGIARSNPAGGTVVSDACSQVEVSAKGLSLVEKSPIECGVCLSVIAKPHTGGVRCHRRVLFTIK